MVIITVIEHKRCPTGQKITATKPESKQTGSECKYFARRRGVPTARRKTRWVRVGRRAGCASQDAPVARRKMRRVRARARPFFSVEAIGASKLLAGGAGGWLTVRPPQAAWGEGRPPLLWQPRGVAPST